MSERSAEPSFEPYAWERVPPEEARRRGEDFHDEMDRRRSVRFFTDAPVPRELIEIAIRTASTAPSGAHRQPWRFVAVDDPAIKRRIRLAAEEEEKKNYGGRMPPDWLRALQPIGTTWQKPYLETVPWLVVAFEERHGFEPDGSVRKNYYVRESVGLACGLFIASLHRMGLATLTHTPSPMNFLREILGRPENERPFVLFPVGYPTEDCVVPALRRKALDEVAIWNPTPPAGRGSEEDPS
ncbi:MAG: nitroreductase family protein [Planctomycetota bacterium]